ncbi:MAG TPA: hypothetical protein VF282_08570 [Bacillota bacterium]
MVERIDVFDIEGGLRLELRFKSRDMVPENVESDVGFTHFVIREAIPSEQTEAHDRIAFVIRDAQFAFATEVAIDFEHPFLHVLRTEPPRATDVHALVLDLMHPSHIAGIEAMDQGITVLILNCAVAECPPVWERR